MTKTTKVRESGHRGRIFVSLGVLFAVGLAAYGILSRNDTVVALKKDAEDTALPRVQVVSPKTGPSQRTLTLPGNIEAWYAAPIYAQVSGYVDHWYKDYGAWVKAGDVLATIDTPSLDAQFAASKATLTVVQTRYQLAAITAKRWAGLSGTQAVAKEDVDIKTADAAAQKAQVAAAQQDVARYAAMIAFKKLVAPFDGVVTVRSTNIGDYVNATGADDALRGTPTALFQVADIHQMRIFVSVPQGYDDVLKPGLTATLTLPQDPSNPIPVQFLTTANAVTQSTRTIVTEFTVDNTNGKLWPGTYANVHLMFPSDPNVLILPEQALLFRAQGMQVAVLDGQDRVHLQNVTLGHNLDTEVQIISGLKATDRVVASPSAGLLEGQQVKVVQPVAGYQSGPGGQGAVSKEPITASTPAPSGATAAGGPSLPTPPAIATEPGAALVSPTSSAAAAEPAGGSKPSAGTGQ
jgi:membrane fusion protein, multidrug efflux system